MKEIVSSPPVLPSPTALQKLNGHFLSMLDTDALTDKGVKVLLDPTLIVPMPIHKCSPLLAFSITSCPHQLQAQQQQQQQPQQPQQQMQQSIMHIISSPPQPLPSPPTLPPITAWAGRQPLISDGGMPPLKGSTGNRLLMGTMGNPMTPSSPPVPALHAVHHHSVTVS
ncbi:hypothetical protein AcW1_010161 [Taiwanofungus camphoratus]|nr:hypothetical protein AcW1_010161 [Antrodia cinnamomea]